jgi:hypothetical protein
MTALFHLKFNRDIVPLALGHPLHDSPQHIFRRRLLKVPELHLSPICVLPEPKGTWSWNALCYQRFKRMIGRILILHGPACSTCLAASTLQGRRPNLLVDRLICSFCAEQEHVLILCVQGLNIAIASQQLRTRAQFQSPVTPPRHFLYNSWVT